MMVELIRPWGYYPAGSRLDVQGNQVNILIERGIIARDRKPATPPPVAPAPQRETVQKGGKRR